MADTEAGKSVAEELNQLRQNYLAQLANELDALMALAASLDGSAGDRASLEALHQRLHKLAGSGGTFGLATLSEHASHLDQQVQAWLEDGASTGMDAASRGRFLADMARLGAPLEEAQAMAMPSQAARMLRPADGKNIHIWLVEDDLLLGPELVRLLEQFGFDVRLFTRIGDAEAAARSQQPDILVMDVIFPEQGERATEVLALRPCLRALKCPLIFISSQGDFQSRVQAVRLGADAYVRKPIDVPRLVDRMERILAIRQAPPPRVLIVDDDARLAAHFRLVLQGAGMQVDVLNQPEKIIEQLAAFRPELVLMDMHMPVYSGPELAGVIRQHDNWISLPIVYLSAETSLDKQLQALGRGADDFLSKPISDSQLIAAVHVRIDRARQLADQIAKDSLTGLLKHASIKEAADLEVARSVRSGKPASLAMLDIDHFKSVNDTYGHAAGDLVLKSIATLLRQRLRHSDIIGRYGGEEFMAVLPECDIESARQIIEDIRVRFAALQFSHEGRTFSCTLSAGIACSAPYPDLKATELLALADHALYAAKDGGRNQIREAPAKPTPPAEPA